ncbi:MAG: hypothetical protein DRI81_12090 [Chloroflexi bacterium]|nr:MAG: hypothetical protein DRI81_12090 [Chloroflexota bacterium]
MSQEEQAHLKGPGAIAQGHSVAAGAAGVAVGGDVHGDVITGSTINQIKAGLVRYDVDQRVIVNIILAEGQDALEQIVDELTSLENVGERPGQNLGRQAAPEHASRQITQVIAAQKEAQARGVPPTPQAAYHLGRLAAHKRDYDTALDYFRQATQQDPDYSDAFEAIAWLQQIRAMHDRQAQDFDAAISKLTDARAAAEHTDPLDPQALALRGYILKTLAQVAEDMQDQAGRQKHYREAARLFEHVVRLAPADASAHNGLGNVQYALGNLDAAIAAYERAIELAPAYTEAYHDLALALEGKMEADPARAAEWCRKSLHMWQKTYQLAPNNPAFSADQVLAIGQHISWLEQQCSQSET